MKLIKLLCLSCLLIILSLYFNGCGTVFSGNPQEVSVYIPFKNAKLIIDSVTIPIDSSYSGIGNKFKPTLISDGEIKQVRIEVEGCKTKYLTIYTYRDFDESYTFDRFHKFKYCDSMTKKLFVDEVTIAKNYSSKTYWYDEYPKRENPIMSATIESLDINGTMIENDVNEMMKKLNYIDTTNQVFIDNVNTLQLVASITGIKISTFATYSSTLLENEVSIVWALKNVYGDTLRIDTLTVISDQFAVSYSSKNYYEIRNNTSKKYYTSTLDAVESSLHRFMDSLEKNNFLKYEPTTVEFKDKIVLSKPIKSTTNVDDGMKSTVTIKDKDGHGSGFLISNDGYIITNYHVVSKKNGEYSVVTNDGTSYKAKIIRSNMAIDLALLKVEGKFDNAFTLPVNQNYKIGEEVIAIGTPKSVQLGQSASKGIVSGDRKHKGSSYLQTDLSVNRGNSGGPIILAKNGELTGVVEFKLGGMGTEGVSFSIPAFEVMKALNLTY